ncbi:hypothetical protein [Saccharothrix sp. Mg75]|uniref:hypothetical protein n=1 Tax=Saccharothrix sp. Mg75 TaxID=3445357 RepID=UPI003EEDAF24
MPKVSRTRRERDRAAAANLHEDEVSKQQKVGYTSAYKRWLVRRFVGISLLVVAVVTGATHVVVHLGSVQFLPTTGLQDLLTGYPMAGLLAVAGGVVLSRK